MKNKISLFATIGIIIFYFSVIIYYSVNAPIWDEYYTVIEYFNTFLSATTWKDKVTIFFTNQHNGHRLYFNNILLTLHYYTFGTINFKLLTLLGNVCLLGILAIFVVSYLKLPKHWSLLPVSVLLMNFQYYSVSTMEIASIEFFGAFFLAFCSLYLLIKSKTFSFALAVFLGLLSVYTCAHGTLLGPIGFLLLLLCRKWKKALVWLFIYIPATYLYTIHLKKGWGADKIDVFENLFCNTWDVILFFLKTIGSQLLVFGDLRAFTLVFGSVLFIAILFVLYQLFLKKEYLLLVSIVLLLSSLFLIAVGRLQLARPVEFRFRLYTSILYALTFISFIKIYPKTLEKGAYGLQVLALLYFFFTFYTYQPYLKNWYERFHYNKVCYIENPLKSYGYRCPSQQEAVQLLNKAGQLGYYHHHTTALCTQEVDDKINLLQDTEWLRQEDFVKANQDITGLGRFQLTADHILIDGWAFVKEVTTKNDRYCIYLQSTEKNYVFDAQQVIRPNIQYSVNSGHDYIGFEKLIPKKMLQEGNYKLSILIYSAYKKQYLYKELNRELKI